MRRMREATNGGGKDQWSCWRWEARRKFREMREAEDVGEGKLKGTGRSPERTMGEWAEGEKRRGGKGEKSVKGCRADVACRCSSYCAPCGRK